MKIEPVGSEFDKSKQGKLAAAWKPRGQISATSYGVLSVLGFVAVLLVWSALTYTKFVDPLFLPTPTEVINSGYKLFTELNFAHDIWVTTYRVLTGFLIAVLIGVPLGVFMATFKPIEALVEPLIAFFRYMPASAFLPLFILWIGVNTTEMVAVIFFGVFFQLVLMVAVSAANVPNELLEVSYTLGTSRSRVIRRVLLPATMPAILDAMRLILGWAWTYVVVAELIGASAGIGYTILQSQRMLRTGNIIVGILTIGLLGLISDYIFKWLHHKLFPWTE